MRRLFSSSSLTVQDCAVFWFVCKAHPPVHIGGYVPVDATQQTGQRTSQVVYLFKMRLALLSKKRELKCDRISPDEVIRDVVSLFQEKARSINL